MKYVQHIAKQQPTCQVPIPPTDEILTAVDGCECKSGFIMDDAVNKCVLHQDCGCVIDEKPYYIPVCISHLILMTMKMQTVP